VRAVHRQPGECGPRRRQPVECGRGGIPVGRGGEDLFRRRPAYAVGPAVPLQKVDGIETGPASGDPVPPAGNGSGLIQPGTAKGGAFGAASLSIVVSGIP